MSANKDACWAGPDSFDKQSKKWKKIARKRRKERRLLPTTLYNFTLSPYFMRKEIGVVYNLINAFFKFFLEGTTIVGLSRAFKRLIIILPIKHKMAVY